MFGFLNINKPSGVSSHKVIAVLRKILGIKQIGHAGTLDPLASGVLPVAIGKATKLIDYMDEVKSYQVTMEFGKISDTYDTEGNIEVIDAKKVEKGDIEKVLEKFTGEIDQIPPAFSAVHYNGKRLYELARNGKIPDNIPSRKILVYKNNLVKFDCENQLLTLDIECSKGTYIRSIVNDLGIELNSGAIMTKLVRTSSSGMNINDSVNIDENISKEELVTKIIPVEKILSIPSVEVNEAEYNRVLNGNNFNKNIDSFEHVLLLYKGRVICLACSKGNIVQPKKVLI